MIFEEIQARFKEQITEAAKENPIRITFQDFLTLVLDSKNHWACFNCGKVYKVSRRPNPKRRNYCDLCREKGVPDRDSKRTQRARVK